MALRAGTNTLQDLLEQRTDVVETRDVDTIVRIMQEDNANYNAVVDESLTALCETSTERTAKTGNSIDGQMQEVEETGRPVTQKTTSGELIAFPLRNFEIASGWTNAFRKRATPADYAMSQAQQQKADLLRIQYELMRTFFGPTNTTFIDYTVDKATLNVKALINADSSSIQNGPTGAVFDSSTHTHYNASATLTAAFVQANIDDVTEHGYTSKLHLYLNVANEAAFRLLTGFVPLPDPRVLQNGVQQLRDTLEVIATSDNRAIGIFGAAEVWVKPWVPANYFVVTDVGSDQKPLRRRIPEITPGFHFEYDVDANPLSAKVFQHQYGFGALNRLNGAVGQFNNASYSAPTFTY